MKVEIVRKPTNPTCLFTEHFRGFESVKVVQRIFGERTRQVLDQLVVVFTISTLYMQVDYDGHLLINPQYLEQGDKTSIYLDIIHELVHVKQVHSGKNCNHNLRYVERPLEIEAYRTAVDEARRLGLDESGIIDYLESDLISDEELKELAAAVEVNFTLNPEPND